LLRDSAAVVADMATQGLAEMQLSGMVSRLLGLVVGNLLLVEGVCLLAAAILMATAILLLLGSTSCTRPVVGLRMLLVGINPRTGHEDSMRKVLQALKRKGKG
jgi:hypothetical protein